MSSQSPPAPRTQPGPGNKQLRNTLHKRKTPSMDDASQIKSTAQQLKVIEDFLGPAYAPSRHKIKLGTPNFSDPSVQYFMSLWPEEPGVQKSSNPPVEPRSRDNMSKDHHTASQPVFDLPKSHPHPRLQANPDVKRILSQPTLLGRSTQPPSRRISASISSSEAPAVENKVVVSQPSSPSQVDVTTSSAIAPSSPPFSLNRPIGAKMAEIWYAQRERWKVEGEDERRLMKEHLEGHGQVDEAKMHGYPAGGLENEGPSCTGSDSSSSGSPSHFASSIYSSDDSCSSSSSSSTIQTPSPGGAFSPAFIRDAQYSDGSHPSFDDLLSPIVVEHPTTQPLNISKRPKPASSKSGYFSAVSSQTDVTQSGSPPPSASVQQLEALSNTAVASCNSPAETPSTQERPRHALVRGGSSRPRRRARSNAEASSSTPSSPTTASSLAALSISAPSSASLANESSQSVPKRSVNEVIDSPSPLTDRGRESTSTSTRPRARTISFAPLPAKSISVPSSPVPVHTTHQPRTPTRPHMQHCPSSWNAFPTSPSLYQHDTPSTPSVPTLNALLPSHTLIGAHDIPPLPSSMYSTSSSADSLTSTKPTNETTSSSPSLSRVEGNTIPATTSSKSTQGKSQAKRKVVAPLTWVMA